MLRLALIVSVSYSLLIGSARAQAISWPPLSHSSTSSLYRQRLPAQLQRYQLAIQQADTVVRQVKPTQWKEGGLVGAILLGAFGAWFGNEICRNVEAGEKDCAGALVRGAISSGITGFLIGAFIGGQFPKRPKRTVAEPG